jgi:hypothetical protein
LLGSIVWNFIIQQPSLNISEVGWDSWEADRRYHIKVKNSGRKAALECKAELFVVICGENRSPTSQGDKELRRLHIPIGWLPLRQNTNWKPERDELDKTKTISGKGTERIYFGSATGETINYSFPPAINSNYKQDGTDGLILSIPHEPDRYDQDLINRFQTKEEFFPAHHLDLTMMLRNEPVGGLNWQNAEIEKAEIRVTSKNTSLTEASLNMISPDSGSSPPEFRIEKTDNWWMLRTLCDILQ